MEFVRISYDIYTYIYWRRPNLQPIWRSLARFFFYELDVFIWGEGGGAEGRRLRHWGCSLLVPFQPFVGNRNRAIASARGMLAGLGHHRGGNVFFKARDHWSWWGIHSSESECPLNKSGGMWTRARPNARRAIPRPMKSARATGSADTHTRRSPTASSAGTQILLNLFRGVRKEDGSHQAAVTGLFSVRSWRFRARTGESVLGPFLLHSPPCCDKHRPVGWRCPGLSRTANIFLPTIFSTMSPKLPPRVNLSSYSSEYESFNRVD